MTKANTRAKILLFFFIFSIGLIVSFVVIDVFYSSNQLEKTLLKNAVQKIDEREQYLVNSFDVTKNILESTRKSVHFKNYLKNEHIFENDLKDMFGTIARNDKNIMQFRYLDVNGFEKIRIDRANIGSEVIIVSAEKLQNKSTRYYFNDSKNKVLEQVWFSNLDLNMERGKVEKPYKPTLRAILPINNGNQFSGIIIINYFMNDVLNNMAKTPLYNMILANDKGYPLIHYFDDLSWGFYKDKKYLIQEDFKEDFQQIISKPFIQNETFVSKELDIPTSEKMIMILQLKKSYLQEQQLEKFYGYILISLMVFIIAMLMSFIFSKYVQALLDHLTNTKESNRLLKSKVREKNRELLKSNEELKHLNENLEHRIEDEIQKNKEKEAQLFAQAKMAALGDMIGNIAHQWRQPLTIISTVASGIKLQHKYNQLKTEELPNQMDEIVDKTQHLSQTIDTFRNFLQEEKEFKDTVLQDSIRSSLKIVDSALIDNNIQLKKNFCEENQIKICTISNELSQVIINIISNAKDALLERKIQNAWIKIHLSQEEKDVCICVEDNAGGIHEDIILRIFEPYFTTKHRSQGTGLGLHMSYKIIVESLKGQFYVKNSEHGAKFFIKLPRN